MPPPASGARQEKSQSSFASIPRFTAGRSAIGVDHILLDPVAPGGVAGRRAAMEAFMTEVAPQVS